MSTISASVNRTGRGNYEQNAACVQEVFACAQKKGLRLDGKPFEIYEIDNRDTMWSEEFLTEIQMRVES